MKTESPTTLFAKWSSLCILVLVALTLTGCATYQHTVHSSDQAAEIHDSSSQARNAEPSTNLWKVNLMRVDGCRLKYRSQRNTTPILVDPGTRVLTVRAQSPVTKLWDNGLVELTAELKAGHAYQLQYTWRPGLMTYWVEDEATHLQVSDRKWLSPAVHKYRASRLNLIFLPGGGFMQFYGK